MKYNDHLNREDYQIYSIFEFLDNHFQCNMCGEIFDITNQYNSAKGRCKDCHQFDRKCRHYENPEIARKQVKNWQNKNREYKSSYITNRRRTNPDFKKRCYESHKKCYKKRMKESSVVKLSYNLRYRLRQFLNLKNLKKKHKFQKILGCSLEEFKIHIEKQFKPGMTWENYGFYTWHIDHIIPLSSALSEDEVYKLSHYSNLQPLWAVENFKKGDKL